MLLRAAAQHGVDMGRAWMIGDNLSDMQAGRSAKVKCVLVRTGLGRLHIESMAEPPWFAVAENLDLALAHIAQQERT